MTLIAASMTARKIDDNTTFCKKEIAKMRPIVTPAAVPKNITETDCKFLFHQPIIKQIFGN